MPENKPESFYDYEAQFKRKINGGHLPNVKPEEQKENNINDLGIDIEEFNNFLKEWKVKNLKL